MLVLKASIRSNGQKFLFSLGQPASVSSMPNEICIKIMY